MKSRGATAAWALPATSWAPLHCRCCPSSHHNHSCCSHHNHRHSGFHCSCCFHNMNHLVHCSCCLLHSLCCHSHHLHSHRPSVSSQMSIHRHRWQLLGEGRGPWERRVRGGRLP